MRVLVATDAWRPQVNGVVRTLNSLARAAAKLDVTIETRDAAHAEQILHALAADGYEPVRMESGGTLP